MMNAAMARAQDQKRWRDRIGLRRIEVYLPEGTIALLDTLATGRGQSRATVIASLIAAQAAETQANDTGYRFRRPATAAENRYDWILIADGEPLAGLERDKLHGWRGNYLKPSMLSRPCTRKTRDAVAKELIEAPYIYR